jgi:hypothetical protein
MGSIFNKNSERSSINYLIQQVKKLLPGWKGKSSMIIVQDTPENREKYLCSKCPSYPYNCKGEVLYCGRGRSICDIKAKGCNCSICPVYYENNLAGFYFCDKEELGQAIL